MGKEMNRTLLALAMSCTFLTACMAPPQVDDPNILPPGVMEPVSGTGASQGSYSWPSDIQSSPMPASMK